MGRAQLPSAEHILRAAEKNPSDAMIILAEKTRTTALRPDYAESRLRFCVGMAAALLIELTVTLLNTALTLNAQITCARAPSMSAGRVKTAQTVLLNAKMAVVLRDGWTVLQTIAQLIFPLNARMGCV